MFSVQAVSQASPSVVWRLIAEPARWHTWAPHIRGAVGLGQPEVQAGRRGLVIVAWVAPVPVRVSRVDPGRSWEWVAGPVRFRHAVAAHRLGSGAEGSLITMELEAPAPLERVMAASYGPLMRLVSRRLARPAVT